MTMYRGWFLSTSRNKNSYLAHVWTFSKKCIEKFAKGFKTEKAAIDWCENTVEWEIAKLILLEYEEGAGI
jgi:hypothetical protein